MMYKTQATIIKIKYKKIVLWPIMIINIHTILPCKMLIIFTLFYVLYWGILGWYGREQYNIIIRIRSKLTNKNIMIICNIPCDKMRYTRSMTTSFSSFFFLFIIIIKFTVCTTNTPTRIVLTGHSNVNLNLSLFFFFFSSNRSQNTHCRWGRCPIAGQIRSSGFNNKISMYCSTHLNDIFRSFLDAW